MKHLAEGAVKVPVNVIYPLLQQAQRLQQNQYGLILVKDDKTAAHDSETGVPLTKYFFSVFKKVKWNCIFASYKDSEYLATSITRANVKHLPSYLNQE